MTRIENTSKNPANAQTATIKEIFLFIYKYNFNLKIYFIFFCINIYYLIFIKI
ncbi:hypothetical protein AMOL_1890 [Malaciobacter molluscorum LMG 25693]|uniref:Uncharacterized protein n=1 Tax=Malaciobacter molluscorum LMG 25693 TaxID=870501 RepID=A0AB33GYR1_9BACT|nr:hypothetical protein AMOL_1890 [Malaciobacter molluscorum LMG 25693]